MVADIIPCYIMSPETGAIVSFNIEIPDTINDSYQANFTNQFTKGRSNPFKAYQNSGPRSVSFTVTMSLDYRRDLVEVVDSLREMLKPIDGGRILAPRVKVKIGDVLDIEAVPMSFDVTWREGYIENKYRVCDCSFAFDQVEDSGSFAKSKTRAYQVENSTSTPPGIEYVSPKEIHTVDIYGNPTVVTTGPNGSTGNDLQIGKEIDYKFQNVEYYNTSDDANDVTVECAGVTKLSYSKIIGKDRDAVKIQADGKEYWINPYKESIEEPVETDETGWKIPKKIIITDRWLNYYKTKEDVMADHNALGTLYKGEVHDVIYEKSEPDFSFVYLTVLDAWVTKHGNTWYYEDESGYIVDRPDDSELEPGTPKKVVITDDWVDYYKSKEDAMGRHNSQGTLYKGEIHDIIYSQSEPDFAYVYLMVLRAWIPKSSCNWYYEEG